MKPSEEELRNMHWRDRWEYEAGREYERLSARSERELLDQVQRGELGLYYQIWRAIGAKGTVTTAAPVLWDFLRRNPGEANMLNRYHCAGALFEILGMPDPDSRNDLRQRVQWDHEGEEARQRALLELGEVIQRKLDDL